MGKFARSARGDMVDFDLLSIKQQLAMTPTAVGVDQRRKFVDEKDGIRVKTEIPKEVKMASALAMAVAAVNESAEAETFDTPAVKAKQSKNIRNK